LNLIYNNNNKNEDDFNENIFDLYFLLMNYYNIYLNNDYKNNINKPPFHSIIFNKNLFNLMEKNVIENEYEEILFLFKDEFYLNNKFNDNNYFIFNRKNYLIIVPILAELSGKKILFLIIFNTNDNSCVIIDNNDLINENSSIKNNYVYIIENFINYLINNKILNNKFEISVDSENSLCFDENYLNVIITFYTKLLSLKGKKEKIEENKYKLIKEEIIKEISMFYIKLNKFLLEKKK